MQKQLSKNLQMLLSSVYLRQWLLKARAAELEMLGVQVHLNDVCNASHLIKLMTSHNITHVVHFAAQAGVRYSLQNPLAYVTSNVDCFLVLFDVLHRFPVCQHFVSHNKIYQCSVTE